VLLALYLAGVKSSPIETNQGAYWIGTGINHEAGTLQGLCFKTQWTVIIPSKRDWLNLCSLMSLMSAVLL